MWQEGAQNRRKNEEEQPYLYNFENAENKDANVYKWDLFQDPPRKTETGSMADMEFFNKAEKIMKLIAYIVTFTVVLGSAAISKGTLLFMTSQIFNETKPYCNKKLGSNKQLVVNIPETERVVWIWMLFYAFCMPQFGTFIRSVRICLFKSWEYPIFGEVMLSVFTETLPTVGSAIMIFCILPDLDVVKGAMLTNAICFIPALMAFLTRDPNCSISSLRLILDVTSIAAQVTSFVVWPLVEDRANLWLIPVSVILISFGWWENYVSEETPIKGLQNFAKKMKKIRNTRYFIYAFVSLWKCLTFFVAMLIIFQLREGDVAFLFDNYKKAMIGDYNILINEIKPVISLDNYPNIAELIQEGVGTEIKPNHMTPIWVFLINIGSSYLCYIFGKFACKVMIQGFSFAFPLCLATPVAITGLIAMSSAYLQDDCTFFGTIPSYLFFDLPPIYMLKDFIAHQQSWIWLIWLLSQVWITIHIWIPTCVRQASTEMLFVRPMYDPFFIDQDIALNRRRDDKDQISLEEDERENYNGNEGMIKPSDSNKNDNNKWNEDDDEDQEEDDTITDDTTRIFACGTMWRETTEEMLEFLKSIMRLDEDQSARRLIRNYLDFTERDDYYTLETHVFFDDAFYGSTINKYVKQLIKTIEAAATNVHEKEIKLRPPQKYETPYGGRLVWILPGRTKLFVHLKDKKKIRAKKRWSQVMYMYYLLGHRLLDRGNLSPARKEKIAGNTYILALDGDIDFQPKAVALLVDLMKKNKAVGAACGRIHPIGSGPMVWYQMFEYAVGHWLQKATEHMIGCVLCSPGCFSLFRGKALMDHNVMKKYTTIPTQARHYVQYDQGEDRWLCTLLLQRGYRVEYSAASDAYTHCPETFDEFYKQRRRWMPSTTANILDLLMDYKHTIRVNDNISRLYIGYQLILMIGTVLGPGTIFLMLVGAFVAAFQLDQWSSFLWNMIPILIFIVVCKLFSKDEIQLFFAGVISGIYGLIMMAVLVGIMLQIRNDGLLAPSSLFFFCVAGEMIVTALLHPKELNCLVYGIIYYVTVPSMYLLLVVYTVFNMNNISWGTRDAGIEKEKANAEQQKMIENAKKEPNMQEKMMSYLNINKDDAGSFELSLPGLFRCLFCTREKQPVEKYQLDEILRKLDDISKGLVHEQQPLLDQEPDSDMPELYEGKYPVKKELIESKDDAMSIEDNLAWMEDDLLLKSEKCNIKNKQRDFWNLLLEKYLHPLELTEQEQKTGKEELDALRDKVVAAFFMLNSLFVLVIFLLTLKKDFLHIKWPFDVKTNFTLYPESNQIIMTKEYLQLEPIGMVFLLFFAILLVVQFVAMLFHRFKTLCQILSTTVIDFSFTKSKPNELTSDDILKINAVEFVKDMQRMRDRSIVKNRRDPVAHRKTVFNLIENPTKEEPEVMFLEDNFIRRKTIFMENKDTYQGAVRRETLAAFQQKMQETEKRKSVFEKRKSRVVSSGSNKGEINRGFEEDK